MPSVGHQKKGRLAAAGTRQRKPSFLSIPVGVHQQGMCCVTSCVIPTSRIFAEQCALSSMTGSEPVLFAILHPKWTTFFQIGYILSLKMALRLTSYLHGQIFPRSMFFEKRRHDLG